VTSQATSEDVVVRAVFKGKGGQVQIPPRNVEFFLLDKSRKTTKFGQSILRKIIKFAATKLMSYFKAKNAPNSISTGVPP